MLLNILTDVKYQYDLHTTSYQEQPNSDRTLSRFREWLYRYEMEIDVDMLMEEKLAMAEKLLDIMDIAPSLERIDSVMIGSEPG